MTSLRTICLSFLLLPLPLYVISVPGLPTNVYELLAAVSGFLYGGTLGPRVWDFGKEFVRTFGLLLVFIPLAIIGVLVSEELIASLGRLKSYILLPIFISFVTYLHIRLQSVRFPLLLLCLSGAGIGVWAVGETMNALGAGEWIRPNTIYDWNASSELTQGGFANFIGLFITPMWPIVLGRIRSSVSRWELGLYGGMGLAITAGIFVSQSYAAIGVWFVSTLIFSWWYNRVYVRQSFRLFLGVIGCMLIGILGFGITQVQTEKFTQLWDMSERNSITSRLQIWHASVALIAEHPITGIGLADFQARYEKTIPHLYFPPHEWLVPEPHNLYLANWLHLGLGGFILGLVMLGVVMHKGARIWHEGTPIHVGVWLALLSIFIYGLVDTPFWKNDLAVIFMVLYVWLLSVDIRNNRAEI